MSKFKYHYQKWDYQNKQWKDGLARFYAFTSCLRFCYDNYLQFRILKDNQLILTIDPRRLDNETQ